MHARRPQVQAPQRPRITPMTHQVQQRLLHLDAQIAHMQAQVECLMADSHRGQPPGHRAGATI